MAATLDGFDRCIRLTSLKGLNRYIWNRESGDVESSECTFCEALIPAGIPQMSAAKVEKRRETGEPPCHRELEIERKLESIMNGFGIHEDILPNSF